MAYGTLNAGTITPGSGNTLTLSESIALGTVTSGVLDDAVTYRNINQDLGTGDSPTFSEIIIGTTAIRTKAISLTTSYQDVVQLGNGASYKVTIASTQPDVGSYYSYAFVYGSCSGSYCKQGGVEQKVFGTLTMSWKAGNGTGADNHTIRALTSTSSSDEWTVKVEILGSSASLTNGTGIGQVSILI